MNVASERIWAFHDGPMVGYFVGLEERGTNVAEYIRADIAAAPDIHRIVTEQAAEIARLRAALDRAAFVLSVMPDIALRVGVAGTSQWDEIAGGPDLFGALDQSRKALAVKP